MALEKETKQEEKETQYQRIEAMSKLTNVITIVEKLHVDEHTMKEITEKAIKGLLSELDAHSSYLDKKAYKELNESTKGEFGGLGIVVGLKENALTVISPIDNTPAKKVGIEAGDIILKINEITALDMTLDKAVGLMRGKPGTEIELTIFRKGEPKPLKKKITRAIIKVNSVKTKNIKIEGYEDIQYIRIASFDENVVKSVKEVIKKENKKGIILDLRNNPGGLLNQAVGLVDLFVDEGVIVSQKGRYDNSVEEHLATKVNTITNKPIVVLVDSGSASASEIVSGALQDFNRAIIVGEKTFGKGSVQVVLPISAKMDEGVKITIAQYYLPSGRTIQAKGVVPDIISYKGKVPKKDKNEIEVKEKDLKGHLKNTLEELKKEKKEKKEPIIKEEKEEKEEITNDILFNDYQLTTAFNILKSMIITNSIDKK